MQCQTNLHDVSRSGGEAGLNYAPLIQEVHSTSFLIEKMKIYNNLCECIREMSQNLIYYKNDKWKHISRINP